MSICRVNSSRIWHISNEISFLWIWSNRDSFDFDVYIFMFVLMSSAFKNKQFIRISIKIQSIRNNSLDSLQIIDHFHIFVIWFQIDINNSNTMVTFILNRKTEWVSESECFWTRSKTFNSSLRLNYSSTLREIHRSGFTYKSRFNYTIN